MEFTREHFQPISAEVTDLETIHRPSQSFWSEVWRRLAANKVAFGSLWVILLFLACALIVPAAARYDQTEIDLNQINQPPSLSHWFGTDNLGRDLFVRSWQGARISLAVGFAAAAIDLVIGAMWGGIAGFAGGRTDVWMMRIADVLYAVPHLLLVILLMVVLEPGLGTIILALSITGWIGMARIVRGQVMQLKSQEFVLAARALGAGRARILLRHLLPNTLGAVIVTLSLTVPAAIFAESFLSFIGLGVSAPAASWGMMAAEGLPAMRYYPWRLFVPAAFICVTMLAFNLFGDGLRDAVDPRLHR